MGFTSRISRQTQGGKVLRAQKESVPQANLRNRTFVGVLPDVGMEIAHAWARGVPHQRFHSHRCAFYWLWLLSLASCQTQDVCFLMIKETLGSCLTPLRPPGSHARSIPQCCLTKSKRHEALRVGAQRGTTTTVSGMIRGQEPDDSGASNTGCTPGSIMGLAAFFVCLFFASPLDGYPRAVPAFPIRTLTYRDVLWLIPSHKTKKRLSRPFQSTALSYSGWVAFWKCEDAGLSIFDMEKHHSIHYDTIHNSTWIFRWAKDLPLRELNFSFEAVRNDLSISAWNQLIWSRV